MTVFQALMLAISFASLVIANLSFHNQKKSTIEFKKAQVDYSRLAAPLRGIVYWWTGHVAACSVSFH